MHILRRAPWREAEVILTWIGLNLTMAKAKDKRHILLLTTFCLVLLLKRSCYKVDVDYSQGKFHIPPPLYI